MAARSWRPYAAVNFPAINRAALGSLPALLRRWLPYGRQVGREFVARNPRRADRRLGRHLICRLQKNEAPRPLAVFTMPRTLAWSGSDRP